MRVLRGMVVPLVIAFGLALSPAQAGLGASIPSESLGNAGGLNYRSVSYGPFAVAIDLFSTCNESAALLGGGVHVSGPAPASRVGYGYPGDDNDLDTVPDDEWIGAADSLGPTEPTITTYSVCRKAGASGLRYPTEGIPAVPAGETFSGKVRCPDGTSVVAGGVDLYRGNVPVNAPYDGGDGDRRPDDGWRVTGVSADEGNLATKILGVCVKPSVGTPRYEATTSGLAPGSKTLSAACAPKDVVAGGGVQMTGSPLSRFVHSTRPRDSGADPNGTPDDRWSVTLVNNGGATATATVFAVCL